MTVRDKIEKHVLELSNESQIDHSLNLFDVGYLSSLEILDLLAFMETTFHITISDDDLGIENFASIDRMVKLIHKKVQPE